MLPLVFVDVWLWLTPYKRSRDFCSVWEQITMANILIQKTEKEVREDGGAKWGGL